MKAAEPAKPAEGAAAPVPEAAALVNLELTPEMTSDNPLDARNLAFYTQKIGEGSQSITAHAFLGQTECCFQQRLET